MMIIIKLDLLSASFKIPIQYGLRERSTPTGLQEILCIRILPIFKETIHSTRDGIDNSDERQPGVVVINTQLISSTDNASFWRSTVLNMRGERNAS